MIIIIIAMIIIVIIIVMTGGPERWRVISVACGGRHTMALALPDNGEVNNREVVGRRLTSDSGGARNFEEEDEDEYEHHGELQNGEYDEEDTEPGELVLCLINSGHDCGIWMKLNVTSCNLCSSQ